MWTPMDSSSRRRGAAALPVLTLLAAALLLPCLVEAQDGADLRRTLEERYEVLPIRDGVLLKPRTERYGVRSIELAGESLAVNGERLQPEVLRAWLAEEAEPVLRLHRLAPAERRALFGLPAEPGAAPPPAERRAEAEDAAPDEEDEEDGEVGAMPPLPPMPPVPDVPDLPRRRSGSRVSITQNVVIEEGEVAAEAVAVAGSVRVDGEVRGDVVAVGGSATINGRVDGEVIAVGGSVILGPEAEVMRDVTSVGGRIRRAEGAEVHGALNEVSFWSGGRRAWRGDRGRGWDFDWDGGRRWGGRVGEFMFSIVWIVFLGLLSVMALLLARGAVERVERQVAEDPWRSVAVGFLVQVLFAPVVFVVTIVLLISVIGWPLFLLYPFVALGLIVAAFLGYVGVALRLGRWFEGRFGRTFVNPYFAVLAGVVLIQIWWTGGRLLGLAGGFIGPIAALTLLFGFIVQYVAWTMGFGAALIAWSERRRERSLPAAPPPPPPPPVEEPGPDFGPEPRPEVT